MTIQLLDKHDVIDRLQRRGITPTQQRVQIGQLLFARPQHLSAEQVLEMANRIGAAVSKATVYNTLNLFARKALIREVIVDPTKVFYDSNTVPHHHFFDVDTGTLADVESHEFDLPAMPPLPDGAEAVGVDVIIRIRSRNRPLEAYAE